MYQHKGREPIPRKCRTPCSATVTTTLYSRRSTAFTRLRFLCVYTLPISFFPHPSNTRRYFIWHLWLILFIPTPLSLTFSFYLYQLPKDALSTSLRKIPSRHYSQETTPRESAMQILSFGLHTAQIPWFQSLSNNSYFLELYSAMILSSKALSWDNFSESISAIPFPYDCNLQQLLPLKHSQALCHGYVPSEGDPHLIPLMIRFLMLHKNTVRLGILSCL